MEEAAIWKRVKNELKKAGLGVRWYKKAKKLLYPVKPPCPHASVVFVFKNKTSCTDCIMGYNNVVHYFIKRKEALEAAAAVEVAEDGPLEDDQPNKENDIDNIRQQAYKDGHEAFKTELRRALADLLT